MASRPGSSYDAHCKQAEACVKDAKARFDKILRTTRVKRAFVGHPGAMSTVPASQSAQHLTYLEALQTLNGSGPNQFGKYKSAYMKKAFPEYQARRLFYWLNQTPAGVAAADMKQTLVQVDSYGGAINRHASNATAVPQRSSIMKLQYQTYWNNDSQPGQSHLPKYQKQADAHLQWINDCYADVYKHSGGTPNPAKDREGVVDGAYYNYPDDKLGTHADGKIDEAMWLYFLENFRKNPRNLVAIKQHWDAENVFHHGQSVPVK
jgi:hypothetical protein